MTEFSAEAIRDGLTTKFIGQTVTYWPAAGSTNDELKRLAEEGAPEGLLAITDEQLAGRGRLDRTWVAPAGSSLLMSLLFRPTFLDPTKAPQLTMICSLAAVDAVALVTGLQVDLKWPNDLLLDGKKLAGVLTELGFTYGSPLSEGAKLSWVVVGLGLNVNIDFTSQAFRTSHTFRTDQPDLADTAISLLMALGHNVSRLPLLQRYLTGVEARYEALRDGHSPHEEWSARLVTLGQQVTINAPDGMYYGVAESVDETGALVVRQPDGQVKHILAGDVTLRS